MLYVYIYSLNVSENRKKYEIIIYNIEHCEVPKINLLLLLAEDMKNDKSLCDCCLFLFYELPYLTLFTSQSFLHDVDCNNIWLLYCTYSTI